MVMNELELMHPGNLQYYTISFAKVEKEADIFLEDPQNILVLKEDSFLFGTVNDIIFSQKNSKPFLAKFSDAAWQNSLTNYMHDHNDNKVILLAVDKSSNKTTMTNEITDVLNVLRPNQVIFIELRTPFTAVE